MDITNLRNTNNGGHVDRLGWGSARMGIDTVNTFIDTMIGFGVTHLFVRGDTLIG